MTRKYLVTITDVGNITDKADNVHTILTSTDHVLPRERVTVEAIPNTSGVLRTHWCIDEPECWCKS